MWIHNGIQFSWLRVFLAGWMTVCGMCATGVEVVWKRHLAVGYVDCTPNIADLDGDGQPEIVMVSTSGDLLIWDRAGNELHRLDLQQTMFITPSIADLLPERGKELCVITHNGVVYCLDGKARRLWTYPFSALVDWGKSTIALADLNDDGNGEVVTGAASGKLVCLSFMGEEQWSYQVEGGFHCPLAVADIHDEEGREIIITTGSGDLNCLNAKGQRLWETHLGCDGSSGAVIADLDRDGSLDILVGGTDGKLRRISSQGKIEWEFSATHEIDATISVGDVDRDGKMEIVFTDLYGITFLLDAKGNERWRYNLGARSRRPAALADFDGDGDIEILTGGYSNKLHLLSYDGQVEELVETGGTMNAMPAVIEVDGRLLTVCAFHNGDITAYAWGRPPETAIPPAVLWGLYRADENCTGAVPVVIPKADCEISSIEYGPLTVGPNRFELRVENPLNKSLCVVLQVEKQPDGSVNAIESKSAEDRVNASIQYIVSGANPETFVLSYRVLDEKKRTVLLSGRKVFYAEPFKRDIQYVADALQQLQNTLDRLKNEFQISNRWLIYRESYYRLNFMDLKQKTETYLAMPGGERFLLSQQFTALKEEINESNRFADAMLHRQESGKPGVFIVWETNPWTPMRSAGAEPIPTDPVALNVSQYQNEFESRALNVVNLSDVPLMIQIDIPNASSSSVCIREVIAVPSEQRRLSADALVELNQGRCMHLSPGETRQVWLTFSAEGLEPGTMEGTVRLRSLTSDVQCEEIPYKQTILPLNILQSRAPRFCNWAYVYSSFLKEDEAGAYRDMTGHGTNVFVITTQHVPEVLYDADGNLTDELDFSRHDFIINLYKPDNSFFLFFSHQSVLKPDGHNQGCYTEPWKKAYSTFIKLWVEHLVELGIGYDRFALYPVDEPGLNPGLVERHIEIGKLTRETDPHVLLYTDPVGRATLDEIEAMAPYVDIWCPNRGGFLRPESDPRMDAMRDGGRTQMWTYECEDNAKHQSPLAYYRSLAWLALKRNLTGIGFWSYCTSQHDPWFLPQGGHDYLLVYGGDGAVSSKRWEACRDGLEDMRAVWMLQDAVKHARDAGQVREIVTAAEACLDEALTRLAGYNLESTIWYAEDDAQLMGAAPFPRTALDEQYHFFRQYREQIADLTLQLK